VPGFPANSRQPDRPGLAHGPYLVGRRSLIERTARPWRKIPVQANGGRVKGGARQWRPEGDRPRGPGGCYRPVALLDAVFEGGRRQIAANRS